MIVARYVKTRLDELITLMAKRVFRKSFYEHQFVVSESTSDIIVARVCSIIVRRNSAIIDIELVLGVVPW